MCDTFKKISFVRKLLQLKTFIVLVACTTFEFFVYNFCKRNRIRRDEEDINGKCVVVTGGSSGIGRSSAREFAQRGATVVIGDVDLENGRKVVKQIQQQTGNKNVVRLSTRRLRFPAVLPLLLQGSIHSQTKTSVFMTDAFKHVMLDHAFYKVFKEIDF